MRANVANQPVYCQMRLTAGGDFTGTATVEVSIDGGSFTSGAGTVSYPGSGSHKYIPTQAETNGSHLVYRFSGSGAFTRLREIDTWFDANITYYRANSVPVSPTGLSGYPVAAPPYVTSGTCQSGSTSTTIKLASGASSTDNAYTGMRVLTTGGTGPNQMALITSYVGSTRVATVDITWATTPDATTTYVVDYQPCSTKVNSIYSAVCSAIAELTGAPPATPNLGQLLMWIYMNWRNKWTATNSTATTHNDAGSSIATQALSDNGTTFERSKAS